MIEAYKDILYESSNGIATITLNRPEKLNAFRGQTLIEIVQALTAAIRDKTVGVIVIAGAGGKAFSVGGDIGEMKALDRRTGRASVGTLLRLGELFLSSP